jgi:hypothetical protein
MEMPYVPSSTEDALKLIVKFGPTDPESVPPAEGLPCGATARTSPNAKQRPNAPALSKVFMHQPYAGRRGVVSGACSTYVVGMIRCVAATPDETA